MKKILSITNRAIVLFITLLFGAFATFYPLVTIASTGPAETIGPADATGPQDLVGPNGAIGPTNSKQENDLSNAATGANSTNENSVDSSKTLTVENKDNSITDNSASLDLNSGKNEIISNSKVGTLETGNINGSVNLINVANSALAPGSSVGAETIDGSTLNGFQISQDNIPLRVLFPNSVFGLGNSLTGSHSLNTNNIDNHNLVSFITDSNFLRKNSVSINANSGENNIDGNTSIGQIETGDIGLGVNIVNLENIADPNLLVEMNIWSILNGLNGDLVLPANTLTGANSLNSNFMSNLTSALVSSSNNDKTTNNFEVVTNTGENSLEKNSAIGDISTGTAQVTGGITNLTDQTPIFYVINVFGKFLGNVLTSGKNFLINQIGGESIQGSPSLTDDLGTTQGGSASNQLTGLSSINENKIQTDSILNVENRSSNNTENKVKINANTGRNKLTDNTLVQSLKTGSVNVISNVINVAASMLGSLQKMKIGIINIFGDWKGNLTDSSIKKIEPNTAEGPKNDQTITASASVSVGTVSDSRPRLVKSLIPQIACIDQLAEPKHNTAPLENSIDPISVNTKNDESKNNSKKALPIVLPAGLLLALSLSGQMFLRRKKQD